MSQLTLGGTYFELDSEEHPVIISSVVVIKVHEIRYKGSKQCYWYSVWYFVCRHCRYKDQSMQGIECYICWHCRYKTHPHIPAHNFLNIQWIFNPQKVLESWDSGLFNHTIYTIYVDTVDTRQGSLMHSMLSMFDTVDTKHIHTFLLITFLIFNRFSIHKKFWKAETQGFSTIPSILYMLTLSIQDKDL